jgi:hypothetical protein
MTTTNNNHNNQIDLQLFMYKILVAVGCCWLLQVVVSYQQQPHNNGFLRVKL